MWGLVLSDVISEVHLAAFKVDIQNAPSLERRRTMVTVWTATISHHNNAMPGSYWARKIREQLTEIAEATPFE